MRPLFTMREAIEDKHLLGGMLDGPSWDTWRALLIASRGEPLTDSELDLYQARTGRETSPTEPVEEGAMVIGRRSGKTVGAAVLGTYLSALCDWSDVLRPGERGVLLYLAQTQKTAKVAFGYAKAAFERNPMLQKLVDGQTQESISLKTGIDLEIRPASFRGLRGITTIGVIADEIAFWFSDETSANPDTEILAAVRPALATTGGPIWMISSPYAKRGELYETHRLNYGPDGDPSIMVAQGASRDFNPTLSQKVVDRAIRRDPARGKAEYLGQFRDDVSGYVTREAVEACVDIGVRERPPLKEHRYFCFVDPSGGAADSMTMAIAHKSGDTAILDVVREIKPPFSPEAAVAEFSQVLKTYRISQVLGDRYAGEWCREPFQRAGIFYDQNARPKSDLYRDFLPLINSTACDLLDNERMVNQIASLDRRVGRSGKDIIDHPPGLHDDVANAVAGVITLTAAEASHFTHNPAAWKFRPRVVA